MTLVTVPLSGMEKGGRATASESERKKKGGVKEVVRDGTGEGSKDEKTTPGEGKTGLTKRRSRKKILMELGPTDADVPMVTVEHATPSPHPPARVPDENNNDEELDEDEDEDDSDDDGEEEEVEEEEVDTEMAPEDKLAMYEAVKSGDIDLLEECLHKPNADINMIWYKENLLMAALRNGHQEMAEFLLDNGIDHTYSTSVVALKDTPRGKRFDRYEVTCRQMAYDKGLLDIVELIDLLQGKLWPFIRPPERVPRLKRPKPPTPCESGDSSSSSEDSDDVCSSGSESDTEGSGSENMRVMKKRRKTKKKEKKGAEVVDAPGDDDKENEGDVTAVASGLADVETRHQREENVDERLMKKKDRKKKKKREKRRDSEDVHDGEEGERDKTGTGSGLDSGHHSMASSKLKIAMLREHDRLTEQEEKAALSSEGGLFPPQDRAEDKSLKDLTHSEKSEAEGTHVPDEGYGTISLKSTTPCISPEMKPSWASPPTNRIRANKAALAVWQMNRSRQTDNPDIHASIRDRPLKWRKISTVGSYAKESRQWHVDNFVDAETSVEISEIKLSSPPSSSSSSSSSSSTIPSPALSSSLPKSILKPSSPSSVSATASEKSQTPIPKTKNSQITIAAKSDKIAGYMRPTKSTLTKKRLSPNFVTSYGALDFQYTPEPTLSRSFVPTADSRPSYGLSSMPAKTYGIPNLVRSTTLQKRNQNSISFRT